MSTPRPRYVMTSLTIDNTLGATFLGTIATSCFYGITIVQTYTYYKRNNNDPLYLKCLVFLLWCLDSLHLGLITHAAYFYAVTNFTNILALSVPTWSIMSQVLVTGVSDLAVRGVFCHRVWRLSSNNWLLLIAIIVSALVTFGGSIAFAVKGFGIPSYLALSEISDILYVSLATGVVADLLIATSMCVLLAKRRTGFSKTDSTVRMLILYSINTGALTSLCALLCLVTYASMPDNFVFIVFYFVLPKLFLNSLLATLNARRLLRETNPGAIVSIPLTGTSSSRLSFSSRPGYSHNSRGTARTRDNQLNLQIQVQTITDTKTDPDPQDETIEEEPISWRPVSSTRKDESIAIAV